MKKHSYIRAALSVAIMGVSALVANIAQAAAPEPSAYWDGFYNLGELTVDPSCTIVNGVITIGANGGMTIAYPTKNPFTVIADVSDCPSGEVTIFSGLFNNPQRDADLRLVSNGDILKHVWTDSPDYYGSISDWDRARHVVALAYQGGETTYIDGAPKFSGNASSSQYQVKNIYIGMRCKANGTVSQVATGMKVYRLAIFEKKLTDAEVAEAVAEYFPQEYSPEEGDVISINFANNGNTINTDQETFNGTIPPEAWSMKFGPSGDGIAGVKIYSVGKTYDCPSMICTWYFNTMGWGTRIASLSATDGDTLPDAMHTYMKEFFTRGDLNKSSAEEYQSEANIQISEVPFYKYDLYIYFNGSLYSDQTTMPAFDFKGTRYTVNGGGVPITGSGDWGHIGKGEPIYGDNVVKFTGLTDKDLVFHYNGHVNRMGIAAIQIVNTVSSKTRLILDDNKTWSELLAGHEEPGEDGIVEIIVTGDYTLTLDKSINCARVALIGEKVSVTASSKPLITDSIAKFNAAKLTDSISYIYNVASGYDAPEDLRNIIKGASKKQRFVFRGVGESGVKLDYGTAYFNATIGTHIVFDGGKHTLQIRSEAAGLKFGANATPENPTIRIMGGAYLTFNARNICGWDSGASNANGIIRVDDGSTMEIIPTAGTCYWAQQIYLEPGATLAINDNGTNFRVNGGTGSGATSQFYVPDSEKDATDKPAIIKQLGTGGVYVNGEGTANMAVYVGVNSRLVLETALGVDHGADQVTKYGTGILEASNGKLTDIPTWQLSGGTLVYDGELVTAKLNGATLAGKEMVVISDTLHVAGGNSTVKNVMFFGTTFGFGTSNTKLFADNFVYSPVGDVTSEGNGVVVAKDLTIGDEAGLPSAVGLDVNDDDGILRLVATEWETPRTLCGGTLQAPSGKVKRTIYLGDKAYKTKVLFDTTAKTIEVFKPGLLFFVQ